MRFPAPGDPGIAAENRASKYRNAGYQEIAAPASPARRPVGAARGGNRSTEGATFMKKKILVVSAILLALFAAAFAEAAPAIEGVIRPG
jgi:hypothetical protein